MTLPFPQQPSDTVKRRANWLGRYLGVEKKADRELFNALIEAMKSIDDILLTLPQNPGKTKGIRRLQLSLARREIHAQLIDLFGGVEKIVKKYQSEAAEAAVMAALADEKRLLSKIFRTKIEQEEYAKSLQLSAARNIDATMTRVYKTKIPLSKRVYKSQARSRGLVDREINNALARGDSFQQLAKRVESLINPKVPGGVSYAAKRLARTEINNAFHAQSIQDALDMPWVTQMRWNLSKVHANDPKDPCEDYARTGLFPVEQVPSKPHPHCRCFVTPEPVNDTMFDHMLDSGQMDSYLDKFISSG